MILRDCTHITQFFLLLGLSVMSSTGCYVKELVFNWTACFCMSVRKKKKRIESGQLTLVTQCLYTNNYEDIVALFCNISCFNVICCHM